MYLGPSPVPATYGIFVYNKLLAIINELEKNILVRVFGTEHAGGKKRRRKSKISKHIYRCHIALKCVSKFETEDNIRLKEEIGSSPTSQQYNF